MDRVYEADVEVSTPPSAPATPATGYPRQGDPAIALNPTEPGAHWFYMITEELRYLVSQAGLTPSHTNYKQVHDAVAALIAAGSNSIPVGAAVPFFGGTVHAGFLKANGAAVSRTAYAALFAEIGTLYGVGDGSTTFNLPDSRGEFMRGWDDARGIDVGRALGSWQKATGISDIVQTATYTVADSPDSTDTTPATSKPFYNGPNHGSIANTWKRTRPRNLAVQFLIKY